MAVIGPNPGIIPMKVPAKHPATTHARLAGWKAVARPVAIPSHIGQENQRPGSM